MGSSFWLFLTSAIVLSASGAIGQAAIRRPNAFSGRMVVVPNKEVDIYSRLWCVYEIYVARCLGVGVEIARTLAPAGKVSSRMAACSSPWDNEKIRGEIEAGPSGYDMIDAAVCATIRSVKIRAVRIILEYATLMCVCFTAYRRMRGVNAAAILQSMVLIVCAVVPPMLGTMLIFWRARGAPCPGTICRRICLLACLGLVFMRFDNAWRLLGIVWSSCAFLSVCLFAGAYTCPGWYLTKSRISLALSVIVWVCCVVGLLWMDRAPLADYYPSLVFGASQFVPCTALFHDSWYGMHLYGFSRVGWSMDCRCGKASSNATGPGGKTSTAPSVSGT